MTRSFPHLALGAALVAGASAAARPAAAQAKNAPAAPAGPTCDISQNNPGSLGLAFLSIQGAQNLPDTAAKLKSLRSAVARVTGDANAAKANPTGTALTLSQAFMLMAQDLRLSTNATRADLGYTGGNGAESVDLLKTIDSLATSVEQAKPNCAPAMSQIRQNAWVPVTNASLAALNANPPKPDSAARLAERALIVYKGSPLPYYVLANVAQSKGDAAAASRYWPQVATLAANDTTQQGRDLRSAALQNLAVNAVSAAQAAPAADKAARGKEAADAIRTFLAAYPNSPDAPRLQATLADMVQLTGDKSALGAVYADQLNNASKYDDLALTNAGVIASKANNNDDAAKLFAAALEKNPYQRDALNNLTATYYQQQKWAQMIPVGQRLIAVDPENPANYLFLAYAYQGLAKAAPQGAQKTAYTDSLVKYNQLSEQMPVKVSFTEFTRGESRAVLGVNVEARKVESSTTTTRAGARAGTRPAAAAAAGGSKTYTLAVEFLDRNGQVVDTQNVSVGPLAVGDSKSARVETAKSGVTAFRYKLVS
ncbi:hypothetical protein tb265_25310 [Gemmatimonadetes bacterium T265]|nr:hypothetical protein tb265_25310 [Gemmatimonadetes bacterium T265]